MRRIRLRYAVIGLLLAGCANTPGATEDSPQTSVRQAVVANTTAVSSGKVGGGPRLGKPDPEARKRPTGGRLPTAEEAERNARRVKRVTEVKLTPLAIERIQSSTINSIGQAAKANGFATPVDGASLAAQAAPLGSDLVMASASDSATGAAQPGATTSTLAVTTLPNSVDNSQLKSFPPIGNQGGLGSCETFAIAYYQYTHEVGLLAGWDNKSPSSTDATKFSPKWLYNLSNGGEDAGTYEGTNYALMMDHGALTLADFPYVGDPSNPLNYREWPVGVAIWEKALKYKLVAKDSGRSPCV